MTLHPTLTRHTDLQNKLHSKHERHIMQGPVDGREDDDQGDDGGGGHGGDGQAQDGRHGSRGNT